MLIIIVESVADSQLSQAWLFDHGWRPRSVLSRVLWQMLEPLPQRDLVFAVAALCHNMSQ